MVLQYKTRNSLKTSVHGKGLVNKLINGLPFELHLPGHNFCGPGTRLKERLSKGQQGINPLDAACREHDIAYSKYKDITSRHKADKALEQRAWERVLAKDSSISEKGYSYLVSNAMKAKVKMGMGIKKPQNKKCCGKKLFNSTIRSATKILKKLKPQDTKDAIKIARKSIKDSLKGKKSQVIIPRIIKVSKVGGFLPLIPILSTLAALGGLASGGSAIAKAVNSAKAAKNQFDEASRHNKTMEAIAMGKGLYLKPYKKGYGLVYNRTSKNF